MSFGPLITPDELAIADEGICLLDARRGSDYRAGHLPGALLADLEVHLSSASSPGFDASRGGRHPLPSPVTWAAQLGAWGIGPDTRVVAYDGASGANAAARLWWMLRAFGHPHAAVLDGGLAAARAAGLQSTTVVPAPRLALPPYPGERWSWPQADLDEVDRCTHDPRWKVIDVRSPERWRGETEPFDPVPGRIPGTVNVPYAESLRPDGRFERPGVLRRRLQAALGDTPPERVVVHCGSGVTACHTLLALDLAGLHGAALYVGSYGEWCRRGLAIARGEGNRPTR